MKCKEQEGTASKGLELLHEPEQPGPLNMQWGWVCRVWFYVSGSSRTLGMGGARAGPWHCRDLGITSAITESQTAPGQRPQGVTWSSVLQQGPPKAQGCVQVVLESLC